MMRMIPKFVVEVKGGRILWTNALTDMWRNNLLNLGDGTYELFIRRPEKPKSDAQRSVYWGIIMKVIADETGMDPLEVHAYCKEKFLPFDKDSTETLNTAEAEEYYTKIRNHFSLDFNIIIPLPNEVL